MTRIGEKIRKEREKRGFCSKCGRVAGGTCTQEQLALALGVSRKHLNAIENGRAEPSYDLCKRLGKVFQMDMVEFWRLTDIY